MLREATVRELLDTCSTCYGGGDELLELARGNQISAAAPAGGEGGARAEGAPLAGMSTRQAAASTRRSSRSPHLSLAAVVPTLIEVQDSEDRHHNGDEEGTPYGRARS